MLRKTSPIPLYHQLAELLLADIREGRLAVGERIPSEHQLAELHGIGRPTVRQALDSLVRRGVLVRRRGAGTFVAEPPEAVDLFSLAGTMASFAGARVPARTTLLAPPSLEQVAGQPANPFDGSSAICLSRLTRLDEAPVLVEDIFLDPRLFAGLESLDLAGQSLSQTVRERFGLELSGGEQRFSIAFPDARLAGLLDLPRSAPILAVARTLHFPDAPRAIFSNLYCRTDRFVFTQKLGALNHG